MKNRRSFITGIASTSLSHKEINFLFKYKPWGVILFSRNIKSLNQTKKLTYEIRKIFKDKNYPILIDQEGGRVNRLKNFYNCDLFTGKYFGDLYVKNNVLNLVEYMLNKNQEFKKISIEEIYE